MRVRARATTAGAGLATALALVASLSGCITVHGEEAVVPATTEEEAEEVFENFVEVTNEANQAYDAELNATIENGPMGAIDHAGLTARGAVDPGGNDDYQPIEFDDVQYHIPQQAGWPKFFVADARPNQQPEEGPEQRWLLVFTRQSIDDDWFATYRSTHVADSVPEFATDDDDYLDDVPVSGFEYREDSGLAIEPNDLSEEYAGFLQEGSGPFAEGPFTSDIVTQRAEAGENPAFQIQYQDLPPEEDDFAPVAIRTAEGGALVFFSAHHHEKQTMAEGETPSVDEHTAALMEGTAERAVTLNRAAMYVALVPEGDGQAEVTSRVAGLTSAEGE